jgi:hypothetical protein
MGNLSGLFGDQGFDTSSAPPDVVPPNDYLCWIQESTLKPTKAGNGHYIEVTLQIVDECEFKGKLLWDRINIDNPNEKAVQMAQRSLAAIGIAAGISHLSDTSMLQGKFVVAVVKEKDGENNVRTYKVPAQAQASPGPQAPATPVAPMAPAAPAQPAAPPVQAAPAAAVASAAPVPPGVQPAVTGVAPVAANPAQKQVAPWAQPAQ